MSAPSSLRLPDAVDRAVRAGNEGAVLAWLDEGNGIDTLNGARQSLLSLAVIRDRPVLVDALLARGASPNAGNWPAFLHAVHVGSMPWVDAMLRCGADPDTATLDTHVLWEALRLRGQECCAIATRLIEAGADPRHRTHRGLDFLGEMDRLGRWALPGNLEARPAYDALRELARQTCLARDLTDALPSDAAVAPPSRLRF